MDKEGNEGGGVMLSESENVALTSHERADWSATPNRRKKSQFRQTQEFRMSAFACPIDCGYCLPAAGNHVEW